MKIAVVAEEEIAIGFRLAGVRLSFSNAGAVNSLLERGDVGVVFITKKLFETLDKRLVKKVRESTRPVFIVLDEEAKDIEELVERALGVKV